MLEYAGLYISVVGPRAFWLLRIEEEINDWDGENCQTRSFIIYSSFAESNE
jgi:hypothetical protein